MRYKLGELKDDSDLLIDIYKEFNGSHMTLNATLKKAITADKAIITLDYDANKILNFSAVTVDVHFSLENGVPVIWHGVQIMRHKNYYILYTPELGKRTNRRGSFRVSVGHSCWFTSDKHKNVQTTVRDISLTGFSIIDRKKELELSKGDNAGIKFDDLYFDIHLIGTLVRIDEQSDYVIYGFTISNVCKDLAAYLSVKQRKKQ